MPSPPTPYTPAQLERVQRQAHVLAMTAPKLVGDDPTLAVAALTMAACHAALLSEISYQDLEVLFRLHYESAAVGLAAREARDQGAKVAVARKPEGQQ